MAIPFPKLPHHVTGRKCPGFLVPQSADGSITELCCDECGEVVGTMNTWNLNDLASLALAGGMDSFVPDAEHINALPEPVRRYVRDLETRADPAGDVAELALLKENNAALWNRVRELEAEVNGLRGDPQGQTPDLAIELQRVYDSEINMYIGWFWDGGVEVRLGDEMNGYVAADTVGSVRETLPWLQEAIAHFYPDSEYSSTLDPDIRERAKTRLFEPPRIGARAICPHCGTPNARPMMDELFAFICSHCGASVTIDPPKVQ